MHRTAGRAYSALAGTCRIRSRIWLPFFQLLFLLIAYAVSYYTVQCTRFTDNVLSLIRICYSPHRSCPSSLSMCNGEGDVKVYSSGSQIRKGFSTNAVEGIPCKEKHSGRLVPLSIKSAAFIFNLF